MCIPAYTMALAGVEGSGREPPDRDGTFRGDRRSKSDGEQSGPASLSASSGKAWKQDAVFGLSSFPPTRRFGLAVILGTLTAATMALVALPVSASLRRQGREAAV